MLMRKSPYRGDATYATIRQQARDAKGKDAGGHRANFLELIDAATKLAEKRD
jgi:hypothetical protein